MDGTPGAHLHFYGLALDRLHGRVVFESTAGGTLEHHPAMQAVERQPVEMQVRAGRAVHQFDGVHRCV